MSTNKPNAPKNQTNPVNIDFVINENMVRL